MIAAAMTVIPGGCSVVTAVISAPAFAQMHAWAEDPASQYEYTTPQSVTSQERKAHKLLGDILGVNSERVDEYSIRAWKFAAFSSCFALLPTLTFIFWRLRLRIHRFAF